MLYSIILAFIIIICILLTIVILLQPGQDQGISGGLAGGALSGGAGLGARRTANLLSKSTTVLGTALLLFCVLANFAINRGSQTRNVLQQSGSQTTQQSAPANGGLNNPSNTKSAVPQIPDSSGQ
ncbi:MAG TPA: preprotein translocase subunit SecG [Balneolaceae bacterium]|nr:preprotein translocase subunit SecG [Balneolaceae bacterium]